MPPDSRHISYKHIKSNIVNELTITSRVATMITSINWIHHRFYIVSCNNTLIHSITNDAYFHYLYTYICIVAKCMIIFINTPGQSKQLTSINRIRRRQYCIELLFILYRQFNIFIYSKQSFIFMTAHLFLLH